MARVFISYRRADGRYAAGWIQNRLDQLDEVTDLRTAFRDIDLRYGDDFPARLVREVAHCDVLIAVIGQGWRGVDADGAARIDDADDWVAREVGAALSHGKRIIPVLLAGTEPLRASDLPSALHGLSELHAVRFDDKDDLEDLVRDLRAHLDDVDRERARTAGLDEPIRLPATRIPTTTWLAAAGVGVVMAVVGWLVVEWLLSPDNELRIVPSVIEFAAWGFLGVIGFEYHRRTLSGVVRIAWPTVARTALLASVAYVFTVVTFAPNGEGQEIRTLLEAPISLGRMSPWIMIAFAPSWSNPRDTALADRIRAIAVLRRGMAVATPVIVFVLIAAVFTTAALGTSDLDGALELIAFSTFVTLVVVGSLEYSHADLRKDSGRIELEIADLSPAHRRHADDVLITDRRDLWRSLMPWAALIPASALAMLIVFAVA